MCPDSLHSNRLSTRHLTIKDSEIWKKFTSEEDCMRFLPMGKNLTPGQVSQNWISKQLKRYEENRFGLQALIEKPSGIFIGQCGLLLQEVDGQSEIEVGYHILKEHWGKGYATEAAKLFMQYAFEKEIADSIISVIDLENYASQKVAEKNGLKKDRQTVFDGLPVYIYRIKKEEF